MKKITLNGNEIETLVVSMTSNKAGTIAELRKIDKACDVLEKNLEEDKKKEVEVEIEDSDYEFIKKSFNEFKGWNANARKQVLEIADKLK